MFLDRVGTEEMIKVLDFGIAKILQESTNLTRSGFVSGTPLYMSPEQAQGVPLDARADIYSLGVMLHEMLTGAPPFAAKSAVQVCAMHLAAPRPKLDLPGSLGAARAKTEAMIHRMMAIKRDDRHPNVDQVREEIAAIAALMAPPSSPRVAAIQDRPTLPLDFERPRRLEAMTEQVSIFGGAVVSASFAIDDIRAEADRLTRVDQPLPPRRWTVWALGLGILVLGMSALVAHLLWGARPPTEIAPIVNEAAPPAPKQVAPPVQIAPVAPATPVAPAAPEPKAEQIEVAAQPEAEEEIAEEPRKSRPAPVRKRAKPRARVSAPEPPAKAKEPAEKPKKAPSELLDPVL